MKRGSILALIGALTALFATSGVADAHYLSSGTASDAASSFARGVANDLATRTNSDVRYVVKTPCSYRSAHRFVCKAAFQYADPDTGATVTCTTNIISQFA